MQELITPLRLGLALVVIAVCGWVLKARRRRWVPVGRLRNIHLYPLKSGKVRELLEAECTPLGLKWSTGDGSVPLRDRVFVVFDEEKKDFLSGKLNNNMVFITVEPKTANSVVFSYPGREDIELVLPDHFDETHVTMWATEKIRSVDCGDEIAKWMSEIIRGKPNGLRVGYWPETEKWRRNIETLRAKEIAVYGSMANKFTGAYSDLSSYLLLSQNSVDDLNTKLEESDKVKAMNFRPNLIIEGVDPYAEDKWDWIKIGEVVFRNFRPCTRCSFTTVNPDTGVKNKTNEPIRTLKTYRTMRMLGEERVDPIYPALGVYVGIVQAGTIKAGDTIYVSN